MWLSPLGIHSVPGKKKQKTPHMRRLRQLIVKQIRCKRLKKKKQQTNKMQILPRCPPVVRKNQKRLFDKRPRTGGNLERRLGSLRREFGNSSGNLMRRPVNTLTVETVSFSADWRPRVLHTSHVSGQAFHLPSWH